MDVNGISSRAAAYAPRNEKIAEPEQKQNRGGQAEETAAGVVVSLGTRRADAGLYTRPKGLSAEQIKSWKSYEEESQKKFLKMLEGSIHQQGDKFTKYQQINFDGVLIDANRFLLPEGGFTPAEAAAAIAEGGDYSVDATATRIFSLAEAIAGGDLEKLQKMKDAVIKGFEQAGLDFKSAMKRDLPQISRDTYDEIMSRFDRLEEKLTQPPEESNPEEDGAKNETADK